MEKQDPQEILAKFDAELKEFKSKYPKEYLELLKTLNRGLQDIVSELEK